MIDEQNHERVARIYVRRAKESAGTGWALLGIELREGLVMRELALGMLSMSSSGTKLGEWHEVIRAALRGAS